MNYVKELNSFYDWLETNSLSHSAITLWHALMHINNRAGWITEFAVAISTLETKTGLKKGAIVTARLRLQQVGRIDFKSRNGQQSAVYKIIPFENCVHIMNTNQDTNPNTNQYTTQTQTRTQTRPIIKLNETKLNESNKPPVSPKGEHAKIQYADYVFLTEDEYQKLTELLGEEERNRFFLEFASWISGKPPTEQKRRSAYLTILNWHRREQNKPSPKVAVQSSYERTKSKLQDMYREAVGGEQTGNY